MSPTVEGCSSALPICAKWIGNSDGARSAGAGGGRYLWQTSGIARKTSLLRHSRATAAFFSPMLHNVRASSRAAQPGSGIVVPKVNPVPTTAPPPETEPRQVSSPAAARPGAPTLGTFLTGWSAGTVLLLTIFAVPPCPETACAADADVDLEKPTPVPV